MGIMEGDQGVAPAWPGDEGGYLIRYRPIQLPGSKRTTPASEVAGSWGALRPIWMQ